MRLQDKQNFVCTPFLAGSWILGPIAFYSLPAKIAQKNIERLQIGHGLFTIFAITHHISCRFSMVRLSFLPCFGYSMWKVNEYNVLVQKWIFALFHNHSNNWQIRVVLIHHTTLYVRFILRKPVVRRALNFNTSNTYWSAEVYTLKIVQISYFYM